MDIGNSINPAIDIGLKFQLFLKLQIKWKLLFYSKESSKLSAKERLQKINLFPFFLSLIPPPPLFNSVLFSVIAFTICIYT